MLINNLKEQGRPGRATIICVNYISVSFVFLQPTPRTSFDVNLVHAKLHRRDNVKRTAKANQSQSTSTRPLAAGNRFSNVDGP